MLRFYKGNLNPSVTDTITVGGTPVDLTSAIGVKFCMRAAGSNTIKVNGTAQVVVAASGTVQYNWQAADVDTTGPYEAWWSITWSGARVQDTPEFDVIVLDHVASPSDLCTVWDVRTALRVPASDISRDAIIQEYITQASAQIMDEIHREFAPVSTAVTRRLVVRGTRVDLAPYDLRAITSAVLSPEGSPVSMDVVNDIDLHPSTSKYGVYTSLKISPWIPLVSTRSMKFGTTLIDITGDWGFATVPTNVKRATILAVQSWLRRDASGLAGAAGQAMGHGTSEASPVGQATFFLPYASSRLLDPFTRWVGAV